MNSRRINKELIGGGLPALVALLMVGAVAAFGDLGCDPCPSCQMMAPSPTATIAPTLAPTGTPTATAIPTSTPIPSVSPTPSPSPSPTPSPTPTPVPPLVQASTASSVSAVDPSVQLAFVALPSLNTAGHGQVAVINVGVNPDQTNPLVATIDLGHPDTAGGVAIDSADGLVIVTSGANGNGGFVDLINEKTLALVSGSPFAFPAGADSAIYGGIAGEVLFDVTNGTAVVSTGDASNCVSPGTCTGFAVFNMATHQFSPVIQSYEADQFALNAAASTIIAPSDAIDPGLGTGQGVDAVDLAHSLGCILSDQNMSSLAKDPDGSGFDPTTNIVVIGNYFSSIATVINLNGATYNESTTPCMLDEGGTPPNSVNIDTGTGASMPGVAVNPATHQAFLSQIHGQSIALLGLPATSVVQLAGSDVIALANTTMPNLPNGQSFSAQGFPYATLVDPTNNVAYLVDSSYGFLARIDLKTLQNAPATISTPLPAGNCAGTTTTFSCSNGNGVTFFPM